jgi:hypothetical protein
MVVIAATAVCLLVYLRAGHIVKEQPMGYADSNMPGVIRIVKISGTSNSHLWHRDAVASTATEGVQPPTEEMQKVATIPEATEQCRLPVGGFKGWNSGVVTALKPDIARNCEKIFAGDEEQIKIVNAKNKIWSNPLSDKKILRRSKNCTWVADYFKGNLYTTKLERSFPVAYSFVIHNSPQQILRLLKFLYRLENTYCIHPDLISTPTFSGIFQNIANCLENVIISSKILKVRWGRPSLIEAGRSCLKDLVDVRSRLPAEKRWKYVINLCGKEIPLVTTHGIVSRLSKLNGTTDIRGKEVHDKYTLSRLRNRTIPHNLKFYKSSTFNALSYKFARFLLKNSTAIKLYKFFKKCKMPEEHFYATLYMMPGVPGGFNPRIPKKLFFGVASAIWVYGQGTPCRGKTVHSVCIVGTGDLKYILNKRKTNDALFHNKYFMELDHTIMDCMEERLVQENRIEFEHDGCQRSII